MVHRSKINIQKEVVTAMFSPPIPIEDQKFYDAVTLINTSGICYEKRQNAVADSIFPLIRPGLKSYLDTLSAYTVKSATPNDFHYPTPRTIDVLLDHDAGKEWLQLVVSCDRVVASMRRDRSRSISDISPKVSPKYVIKEVKLCGAVDLGVHELYAEKGQDWCMEQAALIAEALLKNEPVSPAWELRLEDYGGYKSKAYRMAVQPQLFLGSRHNYSLPYTLFIHQRRLAFPIDNPTIKRMAEASRAAQDVRDFYAAHSELKEAIDLLHEADDLNHFNRTGLTNLENKISEEFEEVSEKTGEPLLPLDFGRAKKSIRDKTKKYVDQINAIITPLQPRFPREIMKYATR